MANKRIVDYIKSLMQQGYDVYTIRSVLIKYGYTNEDVDDALNSIYHPTIRHEIHLSNTTLLAVILLVLVAGTVLFFYYYPPKQPSKLLDLNLEPVKTKVEAGDSITFIKELSNLGSSKRYDVTIKHEILDPKTFKVVTEKTETTAIETFGSTQTNILVPKDTQPGDYMLRTIVEYENKKAVATLPVKITSSSAESCFDGIKNQDEGAIDCGGVCKPCQKQNTQCNDNNPCTNDIIENGACTSKLIAPCCGNNICEKQEVCAQDCKAIEPSPVISTDTLEEIKGIAKTNPNEALQQCNKIEVPSLKDTCISNIGEVQKNKEYCIQVRDAEIKDICYSNVAEVTSDNSICQEVVSDDRRDSCYMTFALDNKDYSECNKLTNTYLKQSCESLRQWNELNQQ